MNVLCAVTRREVAGVYSLAQETVVNEYLETQESKA
jgi:hypothetical protein